MLAQLFKRDRKEELHFERTYPAPIDAVWRAWTDAESLRAWWGPEVTTVAGSGAQGFAGDGDVPTRAMFDFPQAVAADADGVLYIADERNDRVRKIYPGGGAVGGRVVAEGDQERVDLSLGS
jgi:hypothetical protein